MISSAVKVVRRQVIMLMLILIVTFGPALFGCTYTGGKVALRSQTYASPEAAFLALAASSRIIQNKTLIVTARIEINKDGKRYPLKAALMMRKPARFRLESIPLLGPPDFLLSIDSGELRVFLPEKGAFYAGKDTLSNLSHFFPLALPTSEMVALLTGSPPDEEQASVSASRGEWEENVYRVDRYIAGQKLRSLWIDPATDLLLRTEVFSGSGMISYTAELAEHTRVGECYLPQQLTITRDSDAMSIRYTEIRVDDEAASFALEIPEGITPIPFDK
jgi:hypothetical protein